MWLLHEQASATWIKVSLLLSDREPFEGEEFGDMWNDVSLAKLT